MPAQYEEFEESDSRLPDMPCHCDFFKSRCFRVIVYIFLCILDTARLVSLWFLYDKVSAPEEGLVYGPPQAELSCFLLIFSLIGSAALLFELIDLKVEMFTDTRWEGCVDIEVLSVITLWITDVPQMIINVLLFTCRDEAISWLQLLKTTLAIAVAAIRLGHFIFQKCKKGCKCRDSICTFFRQGGFILGIFITLAGAIVVFLFSFYERHPDGSLNFKEPNTLYEGKYDIHKYFDNVGIYFSHELFDSGTNHTKENINLVRLLTINDIKRQQTDQVVRIQYDQVTGQRKIVINKTDSVGNSTECFQTKPGTDRLSFLENCTSLKETENTTEIIFKFRYIPMLIFGDIRYNVKLLDKASGSVCKSLDFSITDDLGDHVQNSNVSALHYYRSSNSPDTHSNGKFYHSKNLEDVSEVWKTGSCNCESTGRMAPHYDDSIPVDCN